MPVEIKTFKVLKEIGRPDILLSLARVSGSSRLLAGSFDGNVYDVDPLAEKPEFKPLAGHESYVTGLAICGQTLASGSYDGRLIFRDLKSGETIRTIDQAHTRWIRKLAASPDGARLASVGDDMACRVWDAADGKLLHELQGHEPRTPHHFPSMLYTCAISPCGQWLATADRVGRIVLWDFASGSQARVIEAPGFYTWDPRQRIHSIGGIRSLAFSPDSQVLCAGGIGKIGNIDHLDGPSRVEAFQVSDGERLHEFSGEMKGMVEHLAFHPQGDWLIGAGGDNGGLLQFYDLQEKKVIRAEKVPMHIHAAALNEAADRLFAVGHNKLVVWEVGSEEAS